MNLVQLAQRIRRLRIERGLTLEVVAKRCGLSKSALSKVENFRVTPSLPALDKIASVLGLTVADLVAGLEDKPQMVIVRKGERGELERDRPESKIVYRTLAHKRIDKIMEPFLLTVPPGKARKKALAHEGEEFLMVLHGSVDFEYGGERHQLYAGDCMYLDGGVRHTLINPNSKPADVLVVYADQIWRGAKPGLDKDSTRGPAAQRPACTRPRGSAGRFVMDHSESGSIRS